TDVTDTATGTIQDNDTASFTIGDVTASEGGNLVFSVSLSNPRDTKAGTKVNFGGGLATGGGKDYTSTTQAVTFAPNSTAAQSVTVPTNNYYLVLQTEPLPGSSPLPYTTLFRSTDVTDTATGTIQDNDTASFTISDVTASEGGNLVFSVSLSKPRRATGGENVEFGGGSATGGGTDYTPTTQAVTFAPNSTAAQSVTVATNNDNLVEQTETFTASLALVTSLSGYSTDVTDTATGTIQDNDTASFTISDVTASEGGNLVFSVSLS